MIENITAGDDLLCTIIRRAELPAQTHFYTAHESPLQVGHVVHPRDHEIQRHVHRAVVRTVTGTAEVLVVQRGQCEVDIYDRDRTLVATRPLFVGDVLVLVRGGHGFRMVDDTVLLEIKQGPYAGPDEKETF